MQTLRQFFQDSGAIPESQRLLQIEHALVEERRTEMPWYLRFIVGLGAWLASAFFIGFFIVLIGWQENQRFTIGVSGAILLVLAIALFRQKLGIFVSQCCLAASFAGQFMIYYGFLPTQHFTLGSAVILSIGLAVILYGIYPDVLQRLVTCLAALQLTLAWIYLGDDGNGFSSGTQLGHDVLMAASAYWILHLVALVGCFLFVWRRSTLLVPLGHALVISLAAWQLENLGGLWLHNESASLLPTNDPMEMWPYYIHPISTALMLFAVITWAAGGTGAWCRFALPFAGFAAALVIIIWLGAGGILLPLLLIVLGFFVESTVIKGYGLILLPIFLFSYYYNLHLDLLAKSATLIGSGLALLLLRSALKRWLLVDIREAA